MLNFGEEEQLDQVMELTLSGFKMAMSELEDNARMCMMLHDSTKMNNAGMERKLTQQLQELAANHPECRPSVNQHKLLIAQLEAEKQLLVKDKEAAQQQAAGAAKQLELARQEAAEAEASQDTYAEQEVQQEITQLEKWVAPWESNLGIAIKRGNQGVQGSEMPVVFTLIDPRNHQREFRVHIVVDVSVDGCHGVYSVTQCQPWLPTIPTLLCELNHTRSLKKFLLSVRKEFRNMVMRSLD